MRVPESIAALLSRRSSRMSARTSACPVTSRTAPQEYTGEVSRSFRQSGKGSAITSGSEASRRVNAVSSAVPGVVTCTIPVPPVR